MMHVITAFLTEQYRNKIKEFKPWSKDFCVSYELNGDGPIKHLELYESDLTYYEKDGITAKLKMKYASLIHQFIEKIEQIHKAVFLYETSETLDGMPSEWIFSSELLTDFDQYLDTRFSESNAKHNLKESYAVSLCKSKDDAGILFEWLLDSIHERCFETVIKQEKIKLNIDYDDFASYQNQRKSFYSSIDEYQRSVFSLLFDQNPEKI